MDVEQFRRKIARTITAKQVGDYEYHLECGHIQPGDTGMTHKQALRRKTVICQGCRRDAWEARWEAR